MFVTQGIPQQDVWYQYDGSWIKTFIMNIKLKLWILILLPSNKRYDQSNFGWHILDYLTKALYDLKEEQWITVTCI